MTERLQVYSLLETFEDGNTEARRKTCSLDACVTMNMQFDDLKNMFLVKRLA